MIRAAICTLALQIAGCAGAHDWTKAAEVKAVRVVKIESPAALELCSAIADRPLRACSLRLRDTATGEWRCIVVMMPGDGQAAAHEAGGHCLGYDHSGLERRRGVARRQAVDERDQQRLELRCARECMAHREPEFLNRLGA